MKTLEQLLTSIEIHIPNYKKRNEQVSNATIGWQLDHSLLVLNGVITQLKNSNPEEYKWRFNRMRVFIQLINTIPRGKVKSPKSVRPTETATPEGLQSKLELAKMNIAELKTLPANRYFTHPIFGDLNVKSAIWFLKLHTQHHLKIVEDILRKG